MTITATLTLALALLRAAGPAGDDTRTREAEPYAAIERLLEAGALEQAQRQLDAATLSDAARARLQGSIALRRGDAAAAVRAFDEALRATPDDATLRLWLATAQLQAGDVEAADASLAGTESLARTVIAQPLLRGRIALARGHADAAYAAFAQAADDFPDAAAPRLELVALCAEQSLFTAARAWAESIPAAALDATAARLVLAALHRDRAALPLLERIAARLRDDPEIVARLAHAWAAAGQPYTAAMLFERAWALGGDHAFAAADQWRMAGQSRRALAMNARVTDTARRLDQRASILFAAGQYARVVALEPAMRRAGVDGELARQRLAHAHFALGQHARASELARSLLGGRYDANARALLSAMGRSAQPDADAPAP